MAKKKASSDNRGISSSLSHQKQQHKRTSSLSSMQNRPQSSSNLLQQPISSSLPSFIKSLEEWFRTEQQGIIWVLGCISVGCLFGFGIGSGWLTGAGITTSSATTTTTATIGIATGENIAPWRIELGMRIRSSLWYQIMFLWKPFWFSGSSALQKGNDIHADNNNMDGPLHPSHPLVYSMLREAVVREKGGYVHKDLGWLIPAPCGAARGLGMVRDSYHKCQSRCFPGVAEEKIKLRRKQTTMLEEGESKIINASSAILWRPPIADRPVYKQEEVLIRVPLSFQMTRSVALGTLLARLPAEVQRNANPHELDDASLLALLLAHEVGVGRHSRWYPYFASLPKEPSCGYSSNLRRYAFNSLNVLREELEVDTTGWKGELSRADELATKIVQSLAKDYGPHIKTRKGMTAFQSIYWAMCHVSSRAIAGSEQFGAVRLVPIMDMINHDADAGGYVEITGKEKWDHGDFVDATEDQAGTFVVRSLRHGRRKALKVGQELLVNYNVPHYSPLDWFVSSGFVPPERQQPWEKIDSALPQVRQDEFGSGGPGVAPTNPPTIQVWNEDYGPQVLAMYKEHQKKKKQRRAAANNDRGETESNGDIPSTES